jgi:hypothetical protein
MDLRVVLFFYLIPVKKRVLMGHIASLLRFNTFIVLIHSSRYQYVYQLAPVTFDTKPVLSVSIGLHGAKEKRGGGGIFYIFSIVCAIIYFQSMLQHPWSSTISFAIDLEAIGIGGKSGIFQVLKFCYLRCCTNY